MTAKSNILVTAERTLKVLSMFKHKGEYTLQEITDELNTSKSIIFRTLHTLESMGYLLKDDQSKIYTLGYEVYRLGRSFAQNKQINQVAYPILEEFHQLINETVCIVVPDLLNLSAVQIIEIETTHPIKHTVNINRVGDLHTGATRKTLLAHLSDDIINKFIKKTGLPKRTDFTITSIELLQKELLKIRKQGYGESRAELVEDLYSVAAPIFGYKDELIGSLGVYLPIYRLNQTEEKLIELVKYYSEKISNELR